MLCIRRRGRVYRRDQQLPAAPAPVGRGGRVRGGPRAGRAPGRALRLAGGSARSLPQRVQVQHGHAAPAHAVIQ